MKLLRLKLENFQGIKAAEFTFDGKHASIYGTNATGKTTLVSAFTWLLFNQDSTNSKHFTPKTTTPQGGRVRYLNHGVEAQLQLPSGRLLSLRKHFSEVYKKKRGAVTEEFDGHAINYFVDNVPTTEREYIRTLESLGGSLERMQILALPEYFSKDLAWETRRKLLLELSGVIDEQAIMNHHPALRELPAALVVPGTTNQYYTVETYQNLGETRKTQLTKERKIIATRIDEAERALPSLTGLDPTTITARLTVLPLQIEQLEAERARLIAANHPAQAMQTLIADLNTQLVEARAAHTQARAAAEEPFLQALADNKHQQRQAQSRLQDDLHNLDLHEQLLQRTTTLRQQLEAQYKQIQAETWTTAQETCPTCRQPLPAAELQALRTTFQVHKQERLEAVKAQAAKGASKTTLAAIQAQIDALHLSIKKNQEQLVGYAQAISDLQTRLRLTVPFETTATYIALTAQIEKHRLEQDLFSHPEALQRLQDQLKQLRADLHVQKELQAKLDLAETQQRRIEQLRAQDQELAHQYRTIEHTLGLCTLFIRTKLNLLTDRVHAHFPNVRFQLFHEQINGGIKEICEVLVPSPEGNLVPYATANGGGRVNGGLEIIATLGRHWQQSMPVFVDNAESVAELYPLETQVIRLVMTKTDPKLRLEVE